MPIQCRPSFLATAPVVPEPKNGSNADGLLFGEIRGSLQTVMAGLSGDTVSVNTHHVYGADLDAFDAGEALFLTLRGGGYEFDQAVSFSMDVTLQTAGHIVVNNNVTAQGSIALISGGDYYQVGGALTAQEHLFVQSDGYIYNRNRIESLGGDVTLIAPQIFNVRGGALPSGSGSTTGGSTVGGGGGDSNTYIAAFSARQSTDSAMFYPDVPGGGAAGGGTSGDSATDAGLASGGGAAGGSMTGVGAAGGDTASDSSITDGIGSGGTTGGGTTSGSMTGGGATDDALDLHFDIG